MPTFARWLAPALALLLLAACAGAPSERETQAQLFGRFDAADTNHDGTLDRAEFTAAFPEAAKRFDRVDLDRSGLVSWLEFKGARLGGPQQPPPYRDR